MRTLPIMENNTQQIMTKLGGAAAVGREVGKSRSTVASWGDRDSVPDWAKEKLVEIARRKNIDITLLSFFPSLDEAV